MTALVFSKDRALQLEAFLRSYQEQVRPLGILKVLYRATSERHTRAYLEVFAGYPWALPYRQSESFREDVLQLLPPYGHVVFFVDDLIFIRPWLIVEEAGWSLRLGLNLDYNYSTASAQPLPVYQIGEVGEVKWQWKNGQQAWGYPLSVDGHVFDAVEMHAMLKAIMFYSPNTLEGALQFFEPIFADRWGKCYRESLVVNIPWNRVQNECPNRYAEGDDAEAMLAHWEAGQQIDMRALTGVHNTSVHQEFPLMLEQRC